MLELSSIRKIRVNLADYDCKQDIENRMLMSDFSTFELEVLKEILFSSLKISLKKLARTLECEELNLSPVLSKLSATGLCSMEDGCLLINKEKRKYFECQISRFNPSFRPDMEFLASLLRKVPIHCLPIWYSLPRTSNNIFESIVEKYLLTPQTFQRHLLDLHFNDPCISKITFDLFNSSDFKLYSSDVISKYNLTRHHFEEILLLMEFNFIGCLSYEPADDHWIEVITPFYEWRQYLLFLKEHERCRIANPADVVCAHPHHFSFVEDISSLLACILQKPISIGKWSIKEGLPESLASTLLSCISLTPSHYMQIYIERAIQKLNLLELIDCNGQKISACEKAKKWLSLSVERRALDLYRNPDLNHLMKRSGLSTKIATEKNLREAEKSVKRVLHGDWVFFDDFFKGITVPFTEDSAVVLKQIGRHWKYVLPSYGDEIKTLVKAALFEWLFDAGIIATGICSGRDCFLVTPFGKSCFTD